MRVTSSDDVDDFIFSPVRPVFFRRAVRPATTPKCEGLRMTIRGLRMFVRLFRRLGDPGMQRSDK